MRHGLKSDYVPGGGEDGVERLVTGETFAMELKFVHSCETK